ncbi:MAG: DUF1501 domain-containing protein [Gammaproteobacteria bacterium]|nr:DUF1501 domain-containing protein [Gammaproteobacteria bacterium]
MNRRQMLTRLASMTGAGLVAGAIPSLFQQALAADAAVNDRILVIFEMSGGNDGLNTIVPYADDAYYKLRPTIGIKQKQLLKLDEHFGFNPGLLGFQRLWQDGKLAIVHGAGYAQPSFSHFTSMAYWHTAAPNSGDEYGWCGRLADTLAPEPRPNFLVNIDTTQSLAVRSRVHTPVVFDEPDRFRRLGLNQERAMLDYVSKPVAGNATLDYLEQVARSANEASALVREAWAKYKTPIDYGIVPAQLPKVASCIAAGLPARIYYLAYRNNAFDTHVQQPDLHQRLLSYVADAIHGFQRDLERLGQADRVALLVFSEFGRRAPENNNLGTDHGTANNMFMVGSKVRGGHYGTLPSLTALDDGDNLAYTTDFRRIYATAIDGWLQPGTAAKVLKGEFETLPIFS